MFLKNSFRLAATTYSRKQHVNHNNIMRMTNTVRAGSIHRSQFSTSQVLMSMLCFFFVNSILYEKVCVNHLYHIIVFFFSTVSIARTLYTKDHEWLTLDGQGFGVLGITDYAQK